MTTTEEKPTVETTGDDTPVFTEPEEEEPIALTISEPALRSFTKTIANLATSSKADNDRSRADNDRMHKRQGRVLAATIVAVVAGVTAAGVGVYVATEVGKATARLEVLAAATRENEKATVKAAASAYEVAEATRALAAEAPEFVIVPAVTASAGRPAAPAGVAIVRPERSARPAIDGAPAVTASPAVSALLPGGREAP